MKERIFITIPIQNSIKGRKPFRLGKIMKLVKDTDNLVDSEAIKVYTEEDGHVGFVANSISSVYQGTISAGRLYDRFDDYIYACVLFVTRASVIASIVNKEEVDGNDLKELEDMKYGGLNRFFVEE